MHRVVISQLTPVDRSLRIHAKMGDCGDNCTLLHTAWGIIRNVTANHNVFIGCTAPDEECMLERRPEKTSFWIKHKVPGAIVLMAVFAVCFLLIVCEICRLKRARRRRRQQQEERDAEDMHRGRTRRRYSRRPPPSYEEVLKHDEKDLPSYDEALWIIEQSEQASLLKNEENQPLDP